MFYLAIKDLAGRKYPLAKVYVRQPSVEFVRDLYDFSHIKATYRVCDGWSEATQYSFVTRAEAEITLFRDYRITKDFITEEYVGEL